MRMLRCGWPLGLIGAEQLDAFAEVAAASGSRAAHLSAWQDLRVRLMGSSAEVDGGGGGWPRIYASPLAGVAPGEAFDVTPHGVALARLLLSRHLAPSLSVALSGSFDPRFSRGRRCDVGLTAVRMGAARGFEVLVGGEPLIDFLPEAALLPTTLAVLRLLSRPGSRPQPLSAAAIWAERTELPVQPVAEAPAAWADAPLHAPSSRFPSSPDPDAQRWLHAAVHPQRQLGYATVAVRVPRGELAPTQLRALAEVLREHSGDTMRLGWDQSLYIRFVPNNRLLAVHEALREADLGSGFDGFGNVDEQPLSLRCPAASSRFEDEGDGDRTDKDGL